MLEAKIHKEITEYEGKIFFGLSGKQIICILICFAVVIPIFFLLYQQIGVEITGYICLFTAAPIVAFGFFKYKGRSFGELLKLMINFYGKKQRRYCVNICNTDYYIKEDIDFERKRKNRKIKSGDECVESRLEYGSKNRRKQIQRQIREHLASN
mgnify:CR=1 FL=1